MIDLYTLDRDQLAHLLGTWGVRPYRARQLWRGVYERGVRDVSELTDLPASLRQRLAAETTLGRASVHLEQVSRDGTRKRLYTLHDGHRVEAVLMPYADGRRTACISTQAGCAMGCVFCATGQQGFARHLDTAEIFEQAARFDQELRAVGERLSNVVLMGMGEPFHNYDASVGAVRQLMDRLGIGARRITVSTVGLVPAIRRFATEGLQVGLAISLHAAADNRRTALLPVNRRWPLDELLSACRDYVDATGRRVTFEWALIAGENDSVDEARALGRRLAGLSCHVNLIPLNPTRGYGGRGTARAAAAAFVAELGHHGVPATVRMRRGIDIDAGCGQLADRADGGGDREAAGVPTAVE